MWIDDSDDESSCSSEELDFRRQTMLESSSEDDDSSEEPEESGGSPVYLQHQADLRKESVELIQDITGYAIEAGHHMSNRPSIIYHPSNSIRNYILLNLVKRHNSLSNNRRTLIIAPSEYAVMQQLVLLKRHALTDSVGSLRNHKSNTQLPMIIVLSTLNLADLLNDKFESNIGLIIFLECHDVMKDQSVVKFMNSIKERKIALSPSAEKSADPIIHCFTSCIAVESFTSETVDELQDFYGCKLLSVVDHSLVERIVSSVPYNIYCYDKQATFSEACVAALEILNCARTLSANFEFKLNAKFSHTFKTTSQCYVQETLSEIQVQLEELGEFGGSIAALAAFQHLVRLYTFADSSPDHATKHMLCYLVCCLSRFRKTLEDNMSKVSGCKRIDQFSSYKLQSLLKLLLDQPVSHRSLLIVNDPHTASIVTLVLQKTSELGKPYSNMKPELIINGSFIPVSESWGDILSWERNMEVYSRFVAGETNILVLCGDLRGLDLPPCNLVMLLNDVDKYSSFLQAKNYVNDRPCKLIFFSEKSKFASYDQKLSMFQKMEAHMKKLLIQKDTYKQRPQCRGLFVTDFGFRITAEEAEDLITRYCNSLQSDKFTHHPLLWKMEMKEEEDIVVYTASLILPRVFTLQTIQGKGRKSWKAAQQSAALKAIKELYRSKELTDYIISTLQAVKNTIKSENLSSNHPIEGKAGSELEYNLRSFCSGVENRSEDKDILCDLMYPTSLTTAQPTPDLETYVHVIKIWPISEPPPLGDNRKTALFELLCDKKFFAILSSKPLPKVCQFPVFAFGHELTVELETSESLLKLSKNDLVRLRKFHCGLFLNVLQVVQCFMQFDVCNKQNSFLIAPLTLDGDIDWNVVDNNACIPESRELTSEEKANIICTKEKYEKTMVKPWYRHLLRDQIYLVATVCTDMDADSCFPTEDFDSFLDYYREKYNITLERPELPLLEVYLINTKINGLLPRPRTIKARREEKMEEFREHMVPELCVSLIFPAALWLKLSCLPSVLHRLCRLLTAEELYSVIRDEAGLNILGGNWTRLSLDASCIKDSCPYSSKVPPSTVKRGLAIGNVKLEDRKKIARLRKPWQLTQEPVDVYRQMESLNLVEIRYLDEFLNKSISSQSSSSSEVDHSSPASESFPTLEVDHFCISESHENSSNKSLHFGEVFPTSISLLKPHVDDHGPQLYELQEVLTSSISNDGMNMDHLQVLGNAFLNLTITVYTYKHCLKYPKSSTLNTLCQLRKTFLGKSYLAECCVRSKLCGRIKVLDFAPGEWTPPSFTTPLMLKQVLKEQEINPNVLQNINLSKEEQMTGFIDPSSEEDILEVLLNAVQSSTARREEVYIDRQFVPIQTASSCVEALVGTYFKNCGWQGALKVVGWLHLLPYNKKLEYLLDCSEVPDKISGDIVIDQLDLNLEPLEQKLGYSFKNKMLLAQAVIHESFNEHPSLGTMKSLAYVGGGILDFLTTCYVYECYTELSPSQLWRLREIVSGVSFLASIAVQHNFHKYLLSSSPSLLDAIDRFVKYQNSCPQPYGDEVQLLLEEHECTSALQVEVPSVLADLLPSLVGAVYVDSGMNLTVVWNAIQNVVLSQLCMWRKDIPLSVMDLLKELSPAAHQVIFSNKTGENGLIEVTCKLLMDNTREEVFVAEGHDLDKTEIHAAKLALRSLLGFTCISYNNF